MWLDESKRRIFLDMHFPDWPDRQTGTDFEPERIADTFADAHVDSVILYAKCQYGNFYYDTRVGHKHRGLGKQDFFRETAQALRRRGIKVIAYYSVAWDERMAQEHPQWRVRQADGAIGTDEYRWHTLCIQSPYREVVKRHLEEISRELRPDGFWIDMTIIGRDCCHCEHCQRLYERRYGGPMPRGDDLESPDWQRFVTFRYDGVEAFYHEIYALIRGILPEAKIGNNYWGYPYSSHTMGSRAIGSLREADYTTGEAYTDWTGLSAPGFFPKWLRSAAQGRPYEALISRFVGTWDYTVKPPVQMALEAYAVAANGGAVTIDDMPYADGSLDWALYEDIGKIFGEIREREPFLGGELLGEGAIWHSQKTKDLYFHGDVPFIAAIVGAYRLMHELHSTAQFVFDENVTAEALRRYRFVLLPRVAVLSQGEQELLLDYLREGGLVIAAGETAWYAQEGDRKAPCTTLLDALGVQARGLSPQTVSFISCGESPYTQGLAPRPITVRSPYVCYESGGAQVIAQVRNPICETSGERFFHNNLPAPYETTRYPAIWEKRYGKGTFLCFAQDVFAQFGRYHQLELKKLFENILDRHGALPSVRFCCPSNVETAAWRKGRQLILHLVNFHPGMTVCMGNMDTFTAQYPRTFEFVEEVTPLSDVAVEVLGMKAAKARSYEHGEQTELVPENNGEGFRLVLPKLEEWTTVIVDLEEDGHNEKA